eukprot:Amastigsp_a841360_219.p3 type:complete len:208 gc:universal Amastigsp_a841360_219:797-174(-)
MRHRRTRCRVPPSTSMTTIARTSTSPASARHVNLRSADVFFLSVSVMLSQLISKPGTLGGSCTTNDALFLPLLVIVSTWCTCRISGRGVPKEKPPKSSVYVEMITPGGSDFESFFNESIMDLPMSFLFSRHSCAFSCTFSDRAGSTSRSQSYSSACSAGDTRLPPLHARSMSWKNFSSSSSSLAGTNDTDVGGMGKSPRSSSTVLPK